MSSVFNSQNIERMRVNGNEIALAKINGNVVFQKNKLLKTFFGDSKQNTTTGKNLLPFPYSANEKTQNGINFKANNDGSITINGTSTDNAYFALLGYGDISGQVKIEGNYISGGSEDIIINVNYFDGEYHTLATNKGGSTKIDKSVYEKGYIEIYIPQNKNFNNYIIKPILSYEIVNYWEPYTGGKPSPNPDYPQKISSINGVNLKLVGKNLFDKNTQNFINGFLSDTRNTIVDSNNVKTFFIPCNPNSIYTISKQKGNYFRVATTIYEPSLGISLSQIIVNNNSSSITINTNNDSKYLLFNVYDKTQDFVSESDMLNSIQLEKGSQVTTYEPYKNQNIPINLQNNILAKVGDYADELQVYLNGDVKLVKKTGEILLNGTESKWSFVESGSIWPFRYVNEEIKFNNSNFTVFNYLCDYYIPKSATMYNNSIGQLGLTQSVCFRNDSIESLEEFKEWLSLHNTKVFFQLEEILEPKRIQNIKEELNQFGDYSNIEIETTYS